MMDSAFSFATPRPVDPWVQRLSQLTLEAYRSRVQRLWLPAKEYDDLLPLLPDVCLKDGHKTSFKFFGIWFDRGA